MLCLHRLFFLVAASEGYSSLQCGGFSYWGAQAVGVWAEVSVGSRLSSGGLWALEHWLSSWAPELNCFMARGIFADQGSNPFPLYWEVVLIYCPTREVMHIVLDFKLIN